MSESLNIFIKLKSDQRKNHNSITVKAVFYSKSDEVFSLFSHSLIFNLYGYR